MILITALLLCLAGCRNEQPQETAGPQKPVVKPEKTRPVQPGCRGCHADMRADANHDFACTDCHDGDNDTAEKEKAHAGLVTRPAHPDRMAARCGRCHEKLTRACAASLHFTLKNAVNLVRDHFGTQGPLESLTGIPVDEPSTLQALADDMLRRRCLRCHVYSPGDDYAHVRRGTGCAACHLRYEDGRLQDHAFIARPEDHQCLSCHYANHVGADYHGRFEHDFNWEYRTPYITRSPYIRPYGVEYHDLQPDIHQQRGLLCIDCHSGAALMRGAAGPTCRTCHGWKPGDAPPALDNIRVQGDELILRGRADNREHRVPGLRNPAHGQYGREVACQVCHAQWVFNDSGTYLMRSDTDDYEMWERLTVQSSSWVETLLDHNLYSDEDEMEPAMPDGITGILRPGVWYMGYGQRRWEDFIVRRDRDGIIRLFRPILDLHLSHVDGDGEVRFDNMGGNGSGLLPYTPHTTGPAGLFYLERFSRLLDAGKTEHPLP